MDKRKIINRILVGLAIILAYNLFHCWQGYHNSWMDGNKGMVNFFGIIVNGVFFIDLTLVLLLGVLLILLVLIE